MTVHLYILPVIGAGTVSEHRRPKYVDALGIREWSMTEYGPEQTCLLVADVTDPQDADLQGRADVSRIPDNLDSTLGAGAVSLVQTRLEAFNVPADWVTVGMTWRNVLRIVAGIFQFAQRYHGVTGGLNIFRGGVTLSTTMAQLPQAERTRLANVAATFGWDTSWIVGTDTVRRVLRWMGEQWLSSPIYCGPVTI